MFDPTGGLKVLGDALLAYLGPLVAASALAMALIEAAKKLLSLRGRFHRRAVRRWLAEHPENLPDEGERAWARLNPLAWLHGAGHYVRADAPVAAGNDAAGMALRQGTAQRYAELVTLTSGLPQAAALPGDGRARRFRGIDRALFELETARMMSQLQDSADAVLGNPVRWPQLYAFFTRGCEADDVLAWQQGQAAGQAERYARIKLSVRRQLDGFQSVTQLRWDDLNQLWAVVLGAVILFVAQVLALSAAELVQVRGTAGLLQVLADGLAALTSATANEAVLPMGVALAARALADASPLLPAPDVLSAPWQHWQRGAALCSQQGAWLGVVLKAALGGALAPIAKDLVSGIGSALKSK
jgi:hypothetical protein